MKTPKELGYFFPPEWAPHHATWLSWPHKEASWPGKLQAIYPVYAEFVRLLAESELVCINVNNKQMQKEAESHLMQAGADLSQVRFFLFPTNDAWCRDHGPAFLLHSSPDARKAVVDWNYNAWGGKYPPYDLDDQIPLRIANYYQIHCFQPGIIMEGGSVEFNGKGSLLTTKSCLLNPNRNPHLTQSQIESYLVDYYGVDQVLWLDSGIEGDDTDGHIDDLTRFVNEDTVVTVVESQKESPNYPILQSNLKALKAMRLLNGKQLNVIELPMPAPYMEDGQILPCSYANFYISNKTVIVPIFEDPMDEQALEILTSCFKDRKVVGLNSKDIIWGLGSFHCLSQQEPA
ncbi:putative Agmatine deiminase [Candidatus Protochlamydia naegleriophila]|uniref:Putative Agmatine deiminase n=1 Tax=Candidatus Protochlamydia naegleriophila TaxID=389348 RepID=A0A0U5JFS2_9BACT|nr:agmatine deiminase family protein [Candidatus Protochlamydia naegleriophila]CUI16757.1 putative Agmatine deiminase [Candidatus Protochlamydia naegleriophila]